MQQHIAKGQFTVELNPIAAHTNGVDGASFNRFSITKNFTGDLVGNSTGEMLTIMTATQGSAGYVAVEQFTGTLLGKTGSFVLQHYGTMTRGEDYLLLEIVPDSGAGELVGAKGSMKIIREGAEHHYELRFQ